MADDRSTTRHSTSSLTIQRDDPESSEAETILDDDRRREDNSSLPVAAGEIDDESSNSSDANRDSDDSSESSVDSVVEFHDGNDDYYSDDEEDTAIVKTIKLYNERQSVWYKPVETHDQAVICISSNMDTCTEVRLQVLIDMRLRYEYCRLLMNCTSTTTTTTPEDASDDDIETFIRSISPASLSWANDVRFFSANIYSKRSSTILHETDKNGNIHRTHECWLVSSEITLRRREQCTTRQFQHLVGAIIATLIDDMDFLHSNGEEFFSSYGNIVRSLRENETNDSWTCHEVTEDEDIDIRYDDTTNEVLLRCQRTNETKIPPRIMFSL